MCNKTKINAIAENMIVKANQQPPLSPLGREYLKQIFTLYNQQQEETAVQKEEENDF